MSTTTMPVLQLSELTDGQEADFFALMTSKESATTRDGKPYFKVGFRDAGREVNFPIWADSPLAADCREHWTPGQFYKIRAKFVESKYGPQLEMRKVREVTDSDAADGFEPAMCLARSRFDPEVMFDELMTIVNAQIADSALRELVADVLEAHRTAFTIFPAAQRNHHAYSSGLLEHVLSVTNTCVYLADKYDEYYPDMQPRLSKDVTIAGAVLHDIGKLREYDLKPQGAEYSGAGHLIGHILQGRDMVREVATGRDIDPELLLRLEHVIVSHQRLPEWGSPKPPMTPEALLVHYADDIDAKFHMMVAVLHDDTTEGPITSPRNSLRQRVFRGESTDSRHSTN